MNGKKLNLDGLKVRSFITRIPRTENPGLLGAQQQVNVNICDAKSYPYNCKSCFPPLCVFSGFGTD